MRAMTPLVSLSLLCPAPRQRPKRIGRKSISFLADRRRSAARFTAMDFPGPISRSASTASSSSPALRWAAGSRSSPWATRP